MKLIPEKPNFFTDEDTKIILKKLKQSKHLSRMLGTKDKIQKFLNRTILFHDDYSNNDLKEYLYNLIKDRTFCQICGKNTKFISYSYGYYSSCGSNECSSIISKRTTLIRYGTENYNNSEKRELTNLTRYGVVNVFQSETIKEKSKNTKREKYGNAHYSGDRLEIASKIDYNAAVKKTQRTNIEKYGVECVLSVPEIKNKIRETNLKKYGVECVLMHGDKRNQMTQDRYDRTGMWHHSQYAMKNLCNLNEEYLRTHFVENGKFKYVECGKYFNITSFSNINGIKKRFNILEDNNHKRSYVEHSMNLLFDEIFENNNRSLIKPLEIDLLNHEFKLGIEYNGLMWHSIGKHNSTKFNNYYNEDDIKHKHLFKTNSMQDKGYQLLHIFENEWLNNHNVWVSIINSKLDKNEYLTGEFHIKELDIKSFTDFIKNNHFEPIVDSDIRLGLYCENELVYIMSFSITKDDNYKLNQMCSIINYKIENAELQLLNYFSAKYNPKTIKVELNRRYYSNELESVGFEFVSNTEPNCFYFKNGTGLMCKNDIILNNYNIKLTLTENIYNTYRKIYDSGNSVWIKTYRSTNA